MRVVLDGRYLQDHFPGIARYTFNLARALARRGDPEVVLLVDPRAPNRRYDVQALARAFELRLVPLVAPVFSPAGLLRVTLALRYLRPDVYHAPFYVVPPWAPGATVVTLFDLIPEVVPEAFPAGRAGWRRRLYRALVGRALTTARRVIVPSRQTADDLRACYPTHVGSVVIVPLAVDASFVPADPAAVAAVRSRHTLPSRFVLAVGTNKPHKNLTTLVEAIRRTDRSTLAALVLAGQTDPRFPSGVQLARERGIAERIVALGEVAEADLPALYTAAEVFAFPSRYEGFGLPPLEAMACATPVVCSRASSLPEVVGDAAVLVDPTDPSAWAHAFAAVTADPARRRWLSEAGRARARLFSWEKVADATEQIYRDAVRPC